MYVCVYMQIYAYLSSACVVCGMSLHRPCVTLEITTCEQFRNKESTIQKQKGTVHVLICVVVAYFMLEI